MEISKLLTSKPNLSFDLEKANESFVKNPSFNSIQTAKITVGGKPLVLVLHGTFAYDKINAYEFSNGKQYSFKMNLNEKDKVQKAFTKLENLVQANVPEWAKVSSPGTKEDFWVRLNYDQKNNVFKTKFLGRDNQDFDITTIEGLKDSNTSITCEVLAWFNMKDEVAGVSIRVTEIEGI